VLRAVEAIVEISARRKRKWQSIDWRFEIWNWRKRPHRFIGGLVPWLLSVRTKF